MAKAVALCTTLVELFEDASRWTQKAAARDKNGKIVESCSPSAVSFDVITGISLIYKTDGNAVFNKIRERVGKLGVWNDTVSHSELLMTLRELGV